MTEEPQHRRGRERTDEEQAVLRPYDNGGILPPGLAWYRNDTGHAVRLDPTKPLPDGVVRLSDYNDRPTRTQLAAGTPGVVEVTR